jgi:hypothetical protein
LLQFSSNGIPFNLKELISHLETLISSHSSTIEREKLSESNEFIFVITSKSEGEEIMNKQREIILKKISSIKSKQMFVVSAKKIKKIIYSLSKKISPSRSFK